MTNNKTKKQAAGKTEEAPGNEVKLIGMISHNMRGPLSYLNTLASFLKTNYDDLSKTELGEALSVLHETSDSLHQTVNNLFYWALQQQDLFEPNIEHLNIAEVIGKEVAAMRNQFEDKKVNLAYFHTGDSFFETDAAIVQLIVQNLLANALKFSDENSKTSVLTNITDDKFTLQVMDEGMGIHPEDLKKITQGFQTTRKGTHAERGTGVGLRMVGELVKLLGGEVEIISKLHLGTNFRIAIPRPKTS
jgi:signal transduction histidine kinase